MPENLRILASQSRRRRVYHQFRRNCISSMRSIVYHQAAEDEKYTRARDDIQQRQTNVCLCWWDTRWRVMIYQACGLDKKIRCYRIGFFVMCVRFRCKTVRGWFGCMLILQRVHEPTGVYGSCTWPLSSGAQYHACNEAYVIISPLNSSISRINISCLGYRDNPLCFPNTSMYRCLQWNGVP